MTIFKSLGLAVEDWGGALLTKDADSPAQSVWTPFKADTDYFKPSTREFMINFAVDIAYMRSFGSNSFTLDGTWIHEKQTWTAGGAANATNTLRTFRMDAMYHIGQRYAFTLAPFATSGSSDSVLYAPAPMVGSRAGSPDNNGLIAEVDVMPWQNLRLQFQ